MKIMCNAKFIAAGMLLLAGVAAKGAGPTSTLYLTAGDQHMNFELLPGTTTLVSSPQEDTNSGGEYAIAVSGGTVRTGGNGQSGPPDLGSTYNTGFAYVGPRLGNPGNDVLDGTTDGMLNYGVGFDTKDVYSFNLDWTNPVLLFHASSITGSSLGITYDTLTRSLWLGDNSGHLLNYSLTGTLLSSFAATGNNAAVAFDSADGTLWSFGGGTLRQYTTGGTLLQTIATGSMANILGGEFAVPEPSTWAPLGVAMASLGLTLRRLRRMRAA